MIVNNVAVTPVFALSHITMCAGHVWQLLIIILWFINILFRRRAQQLIYLIYPVELKTGNRSLTDIHEILAACEQLTNAVRTVTSLDLSHAQKCDCSMPSFSNPMSAVLSSKNQSMHTRYSVILADFRKYSSNFNLEKLN